MADTPTTITINGKTYHDVSELPAELVPIYEQAMKSIAAQPADANGVQHAETVSRVYTVGGKRYTSIDAMPADARALVESMESRKKDNSAGPPRWQGALSPGRIVLLGIALAAAVIWWVLHH